MDCVSSKIKATYYRINKALKIESKIVKIIATKLKLLTNNQIIVNNIKKGVIF